MPKQGTLDTFCPDHVSSDAAALSGRIDRIIWPAGERPPRLSFVEPDATDLRGLPLTTLLGEEVRVQLQEEQYCTKCGGQAGQKVCPSCIGTPPFAPCVQRPAERCQYADCPFPDYKKRSCSHEFIVYLVAAGGVKVGITKRTRTMGRWQEQGANRALPIAVAPNRKAAGIIERAVSKVDHIGQRLRHEWYEPLDDPEGELVGAAFEAREMFPDRLVDCFRWPDNISPKVLHDEVVEVPYLDTPGLDHRLASKQGQLEPGVAREGCVIGVRGSIIATDAFVINTRHHAGHGITIETEAPFLESCDVDSNNESTNGLDGDQAASREKAVPDGGEEENGDEDTEYPLSDFF